MTGPSTSGARPLLIGPDEESAQWAADVATRAAAPCVVLTKQRRGDREVAVSVPEVERWLGPYLDYVPA